MKAMSRIGLAVLAAAFALSAHAVVTREPTYKRIDGYTADLKYPPENKTWTGRRVGSPQLTFNGEEYNIVAITQNEVVLSAKSNQKKWTITFNPTPTTTP